jgi:hypothetical protein
MSTNNHDLKGELHCLQEVFRELSLRLAETAGNLGRSGRPPAEDIIQQTESARRRFLELQEATYHHAQAERLSTLPAGEQTSIPELISLLGQVDEARAAREKQQQLRRRAGSVLERILAIRHKDASEFAPLRDLHAKAQALREAASVEADQPVPPEIENLAEGRHSFCDLLTLVEQSEDVDDDRWQQLKDGVAEAFGKSLAIATARKKLVLSSAPNSVTDPSEELRIGRLQSMERQQARQKLHPHAEAMPSLLSAPREDAAVTQEFTLPSDGLADRTVETELELQVAPATSPSASPELEASSRRALPDDSWLRSPLTAQQESELLAPQNGVAVLFGSRIAGLDQVDQFLHAACREGRLITLDTANERKGFLRQLDELLKDRPDGLILGVVPDYCPWSEDWVLSALEPINRQTSKRKFARILFVADPETTWSWVQMDKGVQDRLLENGVAEFSLEPWSDQALTQWLKEADFGPDDEPGRTCFGEVTGNWGELLHQVGFRCKQSPQRWQEILVDFEHELAARGDWRDLLGLIPQALPVLKVMSQHQEPVNWEEISNLVAGGSPILVAMVLCWADRLRYIRPAGHNRWVLDRIVRQAVLKTAE